MRLLTDDWELRGCLGDTWRWLSGPGRPEGEPGWLPARVPGSVLDDLRAAGAVPDPYHAADSLLGEWVPQRTWLYRRRLTVPPHESGRRVLLHFQGVDHEATVLVDGVEVGHHAGMYTPFTCDITDRVPDGGGTVLLAVAVHAAPPGEPQVGRTDRVRTHKSRMGYGWDFCPRMIHQGIWKPVRLEVAGPLRLADTTVAATLAEDHTHATVDVSVRLDAAAPGSVHITVRDPERHVVARTRVDHTAGTEEVTACLTVRRPRLWWPNGHGDRPLYTVTVDLRDSAGDTVGRAERRCGFRRVALRPNPGAPAGALPYTLEVNGRRLYAKGWNWVPHDALYGAARPGRLDHLLTLAADAHVTLLRVWGGGLIETEEFYTVCDRLGLLVWQEFSLSSSGIDSVPSEDPGYLALMESEARHIVPALRHHPALALWGPGNELHDTATARPLAEADAPVIAVLARVVAELDPGRAWLPGSPSGAAFLNRLDLIRTDPDAQHDVHGPWEHQGHGAHQTLYDAGTCLLHSEFGVEGMANRRTWDAVVPADHQWPTGRDNPLMEHLGAWWNNTPLVRAAFGGRPADVDGMRRASQQLQYDGLRYAVEANLRRAPRSSGALPWQFDEPFPNAWCTSAVDHRGDPKPAYYGVRRAYRPDHVCASFATQAWGGHTVFTATSHAWRGRPGSGGPLRGATVLARVLTVRGETVGESDGTLSVPRTDIPGELFLLDLALRDDDGTLLAANRYVHSTTGDLGPLFDLAPAGIEATAEPGLTAVRLTHTGGPAALGLCLTDARPVTAPGWGTPDDSMLDLLPGESIRIPVTWRDAPPEGRALLLEGWNIRARVLD
ncbi:sugar-binding domain-containing protein [Streptomyces sp. DSM 41524]|uniref:beta-mannosidase n=1 Tax=Streptomyces asiaticus subsp. ignotus TaxID=3098222 RepID=A0ABU7PZN3_9ACTN|nr:sugar-binding domain-containing protein [Streptomyces sp. DSM 41524]